MRRLWAWTLALVAWALLLVVWIAGVAAIAAFYRVRR